MVNPNCQAICNISTLGNALSDDSNYDASCRSTAPFKIYNPPLVFDLGKDPGERYPIDLSDHADAAAAVEEVLRLREEAGERVFWAESEVNKGMSRDVVPCCNRSPYCEPYPQCCDC